MAGTTLAQGSSVTLTLAATDSILIDSAVGGEARIEAVTTITGAANQSILAVHPGGQATYGPFGAGTVKINAIGGALTYMQGAAPLVDEGGFAKFETDASGNITSLVDGAGNGYGVVRSTGTDDPTNLPTAAVGSAGALTGAYYYCFTYVLADGTETAPSTGTATVVNPSSQRVNLSGILVGPDSSVVARKIYRTQATPVDSRDYRYLATISDNTTTTYEDNATDGTLGDPVSWVSTVKGSLSLDGVRVANFINQSTLMGQGTAGGYASTSIGFEAGKATTTGRRNVAIGTYALTSVTTGYQNTAAGVHAGGGLTTGVGNTVFGYGAGGATKPMNNFNVLFGQEVGAGTGGANCGTGLVGVGYRALYGVNTADQCVGIGYFAGAYANASRQLFVDNVDRTNITNAQNIGLIYGKGESTAIAQVLHLNAPTRIGPPSLTVSALPAAAAGYAGFRAFVTDANATTFASIVADGGSNGVPVYCDGTNWRIG